MKRWLAGLLLSEIAGCGGGSSPAGSGTVPPTPPKSSQAKAENVDPDTP